MSIPYYLKKVLAQTILENIILSVVILHFSVVWSPRKHKCVSASFLSFRTKRFSQEFHISQHSSGYKFCLKLKVVVSYSYNISL